MIENEWIMTFRGNNIKWMNNEYLNEVELRIENQMWMFWKVVN